MKVAKNESQLLLGIADRVGQVLSKQYNLDIDNLSFGDCLLLFKLVCNIRQQDHPELSDISEPVFYDACDILHLRLTLMINKYTKDNGADCNHECHKELEGPEEIKVEVELISISLRAIGAWVFLVISVAVLLTTHAGDSAKFPWFWVYGVIACAIYITFGAPLISKQKATARRQRR